MQQRLHENRGPALAQGQFPVILLDAWKTLFRGPYPEPPGDTQEILGYKCRRNERGQLKVDEVDHDFLQVCLTTNIEDPYEFLIFIAAHFGLAKPNDLQHRQFQHLVESEKQGLCVFLDVEEELKELNRQGYRLGLLSNVWPFPIKYLLSRRKLDQYFEHLILSYEVGCAKPSARIFEIACDKFGVRPDQAIMVGDNPDLDIVGALNAGVPAVHIDRYPNFPVPVRVPNVPVIGELGELYRGVRR